MGSLDLSALNNLYDETQYFWFESSAQPWGAGAHVTLYPQSEFTTSTHANYLKGQNILINTGGLSIRNGTLPMMTLDNDSLDFNVVDTVNQTYTNVASFGSVSTTIGVTDNTQSYLQLDFHSLQMIDKEGDPYLRVTDLRNSSGIAQVVDVITADGEESTYGLSVVATDKNYTVEVSNASGGTITKNLQSVQFSSVPTAGTVITVTYNTASQYAKEYTFGIRANNNAPSAPMSFASGLGTTASAFLATAEGYNTTASGRAAHAEGNNTIASGSDAHAEGFGTQAIGEESHAEGEDTIASGYCSHAEGRETTAYSISHAEGYNTHSVGIGCHAEGWFTYAGLSTSTVSGCHAEGGYTISNGGNSHSEGLRTEARGANSHAEGADTIAEGNASHASGYYGIALGNYQTVIGRFNSATVSGSGTTVDPYTYTDVGDYAFIIGNGTANTTANRSNAFTVDWSGNTVMAGNITVKNHASSIGTRKVTTGSYSVATGNDYVTVPATSLTRLSLEAGSWIITLSAQYATNATGRRGCAIYNVTTSTRVSRSEVNETAVSGAETKLQTNISVVLDTTTTITAQLSQNSGSSRTCSLVLEAMRIA